MGQEATKFEVGDAIVAKDREGESLSGFVFSKVDEDDFQENLNEFFVKVDDALWFWEYKDAFGNYVMLCVDGAPIRTSKSEAIKMRDAANFENMDNLYPILAMGFRLPDNQI